MADTNPGKDTVYIDVDDEITTIIDKVRSSGGRIVALVLPKRAAVLQSVVNMKLLKRSAEQAKKQLVLITTEAGLLPLAGSVGLYVADSLQSKPEIPPKPATGDSNQPEEEALLLDDEPETEYTAENAGDKPVGDLAKTATGGLVITSGVETENDVAAAKGTADTAKPAKPAGKPDKKKHVPSFNKFRRRLLLGVIGLVILALLFYLATFVLPKATVAIGTDGQDINSSLTVKLDTKANDVSLASSTVPASAVQQQKTFTQQVDATGKQNNGTKATGSVTMTVPCSAISGSPITIPAGATLSANSLNYFTQSTVTLGNSVPSFSGGGCHFSDSTGITAQQGGTNYNVGDGTDFQVNSDGASSVTATGSASGGTDNIEQVVSQSDIDNAKGKIDTSGGDIKQALTQQLKQQGLFPITATFKGSKPTVSTSSNVGDQASTVTVTEAVTYTMFGTAKSNLLQLVQDDVSQQIDTSKQSIIDDGIASAAFSLQKLSATAAMVSMDNTATVGPKIDTASLKKQIAGMKSGDAKGLIEQTPGVTTVNINLSPFWVGSVPKNTSKIIIKVGKAAKADDGS